MANRRNILFALSFAFSTSSFSQTDSIQNLYFVKKSEQPVFTEKDYMPATKGFYIYRNCIYDFVLKNKRQLSAKVIDIKNDSVYYTLYINENVAQKNKNSQDTFSLHEVGSKIVEPGMAARSSAETQSRAAWRSHGRCPCNQRNRRIPA